MYCSALHDVGTLVRVRCQHVAIVAVSLLFRDEKANAFRLDSQDPSPMECYIPILLTRGDADI